MEAGPADLVLVDEGDPQPELGGPERGGVATGAGPKDDEVEVVTGADSHRVGQPREMRLGDQSMVRVVSQPTQPTLPGRN